MRTLIVLMLGALFANGAIGQVDCRFIVDQDKIFRSMPVTGVIVLSPTKDVGLDDSLEESLSLPSGGCYIQIDRPNGERLVIDDALVWGGAPVHRLGSKGRATMLRAGTEYAVPVFLLRTREDFLFDSVGEYVITYVWTRLPGRPEVAARIVVED